MHATFPHIDPEPPGTDLERKHLLSFYQSLFRLEVLCSELESSLEYLSIDKVIVQSKPWEA